MQVSTAASPGAMGGPGFGLSTFSPADLSPFGWYRADVATIDGGVVSSWTDQSGNGRHLTQATAGRRPVRTASNAGLGNRPSIDFDGDNDQLRWTGTMGQPLHYFMVVIPVTNGDFSGGGATAIDGGSGNSARLYIPDASSTPFFSGGSQILNGGSGVNSTAMTVVEARMNGATSSVRINAKTAETGTLAGNADGITLANFGDGTSNPTASDWAELIVFDSIQSAENVTALRNYIASRYGATV